MEPSSAPNRPEAELAAFLRDLRFDDLPSAVTETVERAVIDTVGVTLAGAAEGAGDRIFEWAETTVGTTRAAGFGVLQHLSPPESGLVLGTAGHALDYDDLSWGMSGHPSVVLVPALLVLADRYDLSGRDIMTAYTGGFEVMCAIAAPITPDHYERGWHATATFGVSGSTGAAAIAMDLTYDECVTALNMAASMTAGLKQNFGSMTKPLHAGLATRSGLTAAALARTGVTADEASISGDHGFWELYGAPERDAFSIGGGWHLLEHGIHVKTYPCCYFTHASISAAQELAQRHDLDPSDIERIQVRASRGARDALQYPDPRTPLEAKFSMEYTIACALVDRDVSLTHFDDDAITNPAVQALLERVEFDVDDELAYDAHGGTVSITTSDGTVELEQANPPGTFDDPLTADELQSKFMECATRYLPDNRAAACFDTLYPLESCDRIGDALPTDHP